MGFFLEFMLRITSEKLRSLTLIVHLLLLLTFFALNVQILDLGIVADLGCILSIKRTNYCRYISLTMIKFTIKFLLAFLAKSSENKSKKSKEKPAKKPVAKKKSAATKPEELRVEVVEDLPYLIRLEKSPSCCVHIEYQLLSKLKPYEIDILCWENAAKIYSADGIKIFKTITASKENLIFVPIVIDHYVKELTIDELIALKNSVIEFNFFTEKNKLGNAAKSNKTDMVYINECDIDRKDFVEGYTERINLSTGTKRSSEENKVHNLVSKQTLLNQKNETFSHLNFQEGFQDKMLEIISFLSANNEKAIPDSELIIFRDFIKSCDAKLLEKQENELIMNKKKGEKNKSSKKNINKEKTNKKTKTSVSTNKFTVKIQGEVFFTDDSTDPIFKLEINDKKSDLAKIFIMPNVEDLLTRFQKIHLNPIIIKIISIQNFPVECFVNKGFTEIFCKYSIPSIIDECRTIEKPFGKIIRFMESHIFPTNNLSKIKLLEFLETKMLMVEIYGIKTSSEEIVESKLFGQKTEDKKISTKNFHFERKCLAQESNKKSQEILLAYTTFDLSSLLKNVWDFRGKGQLHARENQILNHFQQENLDVKGTLSCEFWSTYNISMNEINLSGISFNPVPKSPLKEWILIENCTLLNLEAYLLSPQSAALTLHQVPNTFKRLLVITSNKEFIKPWTVNVLNHNQTILCKKLSEEDVLTGFIIDNGNSFLIFIEGLSVGYILNLWQQFEEFTPSGGKVFFNTDQVFEKRLFNICNKWSGFYLIHMKIPLELIFKKQRIYIKGNVPLLCRNALIKLNLLLLTKTLKEMFQRNLIPTLDELISLDIEFGVPFSWNKSAVDSILGVDFEPPTPNDNNNNVENNNIEEN